MALSRVLVVDDDPDYRTIAEASLKPAGMEVACAVDGMDALGVLERFKPDVILLDWSMPRMDGETLCRKLRADSRYYHVPIIMFTVKQDEKDELAAFRFGVDDFLKKPFNSDDLIARIRAVTSFPNLYHPRPKTGL